MTEPLQTESLLAQARARHAPLSEFGDPSFRLGLEALTDSLRKEAGLSVLGQQLLAEKLIAQLGNRLRVEDYFRRHPEIEQEQIAPPLFIVGIPRTGTTKLHRLLSNDANLLWMSFWESQFPVPLPGETLGNPEVRRAEGQKLVDMMVQAMPQLMAIHPMDNDAADEEVMLMEHSFYSAFNAYAEVPSYMRWLDAQNQAPAYEYLRRMLQFLQWQKRQRGIEGRRWVLKAPHHLLRMQTLLQVFPGAQVILTHRNPVQSIPSLASFVQTLRSIYAEQSDPVQAGREWSQIMQRAWAHTSKVRQACTDESATFIDVDFRDTVRQPMAVIERLYGFMRMPISDELATSMKHWLTADEASHSGGHEYDCQTFGLSEAGLLQQFSQYCEAHRPFLSDD